MAVRQNMQLTPRAPKNALGDLQSMLVLSPNFGSCGF
jgi:hypothetical protein